MTGAVFTDDNELASKIRSLIVHGQGTDKYNNVRVGLNARLDSLQAAILIEKLKIYEQEIELRQQVANCYSEELAAACEGTFRVVLPTVSEGKTSVWAQYTIRCEGRDELQNRLKELGIPTMIYYRTPMHLLEALEYLGYRQGDFPVAENVASSVLSLPFHPYLDRDDQLRVISSFHDAARRDLL